MPPQPPALLPRAAWIQEDVQVKRLGMFSRKVPLTIGHRGQLQHCVKGTFQVGHFICRESKAGGLSHPLSKSRLRHLPQQPKPSHIRGVCSRPCMDPKTSLISPELCLSSLLQQDQSPSKGRGAHLRSCQGSTPGDSA